MEDTQISATDREGGDLHNQGEIRSPEVQMGDILASCNIEEPRGKQSNARSECFPPRGCMTRLPVTPDLSATDDQERGLEDPPRLNHFSETRSIGREADMSDPDVGKRRGRSVRQQPVEESSIDIGQLANEVRRLTKRQDSLLSLLSRSLEVHSSTNPVPETSLSEHLTPEELTWTNNVAQRYWASLIPTNESIYNTVRLFLGDVDGGNLWLKEASQAHNSTSPKAEVVYESGSSKEGIPVKTTFVFEWEPCAMKSELQPRYRPSSTGLHADTEAALTGVRQHWPTTLSEEFYGWPGSDIGGSVCTVPPMMPQVSLLAFLKTD